MNIDSDRIIHSYKKENKQVSIASQLAEDILTETAYDEAIRKLQVLSDTRLMYNNKVHDKAKALDEIMIALYDENMSDVLLKTTINEIIERHEVKDDE